MEDEIGNFVNTFHNLEGITVNEKRRNLFRLLNEYSYFHSLPNAVNHLIFAVQATTHLEELFLVEVLIYFRRAKELLGKLQNGNGIVISKLAKQNWFFQDLFSSIEANEFVKRFIPSLSYSLRTKVLYRLVTSTNDEQKMDQLFEVLLEIYGLYTALTVLPGCSVVKIETVLKQYQVSFSSTKLKLIYNKSPGLIFVYLEEFKKHNNKNNPDLSQLFLYIAQNNPTMFCELLGKKYNCSVRLGNRLTKKFINQMKNFVIEEPKRYVYILHHAQLYRCLGNDFRIFYSKLFPNNIKDVQYGAPTELLNYCPKKQRFQLYQTTFRQVFNTSIEEHINLINDNMLNNISDVLIREKFAQLKMEKENKEKYIKYLTMNKAMKLIIDKINLTKSIDSRSLYIKLLTETCIVNNDLKALVDVGRYICNRHRNDHFSIHSSYLELISNRFELTKLSEEHWTCINELLAISKLKKEYYRCWIDPLLIGYIEFLFNQNKSIENAVLNYIDETHDTNLFEIKCKNLKCKKSILCYSFELWPKILKNNEPVEGYDTYLLHTLCKWNFHHPDDVIELQNYARLMDSFITVLQNFDSYSVFDQYLKESFNNLICSKNGCSQELLELYLNHCKIVATNKSIIWLLKYQPVIVVENFNKFIDKAVNLNSKAMWYYIKKYSHLGLDEKTIKFCLEKISEESCQYASELFNLLSLLMRADDYIKFVDFYKPVSKKIDLKNKNDVKFYGLQVKAVQGLINVHSSTISSVLLKFSVGDYFNVSLDSLYSFVCHIPETEVENFVKQLSSKPNMTIQKHCIFLICLTASQSVVMKTIKTAVSNEKYLPIRKHLFMATLKYFSKNPTNEFFELVKSTILNLDPNDIESFESVIEKNVHSNYKAKYFEFVWKCLDQSEETGRNIEKFKSALIGKVDKNIIKELDIKLCNDIIQKNFLQKKTYVNQFFCNFLIYSTSTEKYEIFHQILIKFKNDNWIVNQKDSRKIIKNFISDLFYGIMKLKSVDNNFLQQLAGIWEQLFTPVKAFEEYLMFSFMTIKQDSSNIIKNIIELEEQITSTFGITVFNIFVDLLDKSLSYFLISEEQMSTRKYKFCYSLLSFKLSVNTCLMVIRLLNTSDATNLEDKQHYNDIVSLIQAFDDVTVQLHLNMYYANC